MSCLSLRAALALLQLGVREPGVAGEAGLGGRTSRAVGASTTFCWAAHEVPSGAATTLVSAQGLGTVTAAAVVGFVVKSTTGRQSHWPPRREDSQAEYPSCQLFFPLPRSLSALHCLGRPHLSLVAATAAPHRDRRCTLTTCT